MDLQRAMEAQAKVNRTQSELNAELILELGRMSRLVLELNLRVLCLEGTTARQLTERRQSTESFES